MTGFLGMLDPPAPVPHLEMTAAGSEPSSSLKAEAALPAVTENALAVLQGQGQELALWFSFRTEGLAYQLSRQLDVLAGISEVARRINGSVHRLTRDAALFVGAQPPPMRPCVRKVSAAWHTARRN